MEIQKSDKEQEKLNIEKVLEEKGYLMTAPFGTSMLPFIRPQRDIIVVRSTREKQNAGMLFYTGEWAAN